MAFEPDRFAHAIALTRENYATGYAAGQLRPASDIRNRLELTACCQDSGRQDVANQDSAGKRIRRAISRPMPPRFPKTAVRILSLPEFGPVF